MAYDASIGDPNTPQGLRKHLDRRLRGMRAARGAYEPTWLEIARFCEPVIPKLLQSYGSGTNNHGTPVTIRTSDQVNSKLLDSRAVWASETLANGMHSGLTSPSRPWFKLTLSDPEMRERQAVKVWLDEVERRIYDLFAKTNFYTTAKSGYRELGLYGVEAGLMERHWRYGMVCHPLTAGEYWLGVDDGLVTDSLYRRVDMSTIQHYERFLKGRSASDVLPRRVVEAYDKGDYDTLHPVYHAVEPNDLRDPNKLDAKGKAYRSVYWSAWCDDNEKADRGKALLAEEGFNSKPFWAPRWDVRGTDIYSSTSPGLNALSDTRQLQLGVLRKQQAIDYVVKPSLRGPATLNNMHVSLQPGRITAMAMVDKDSFGPIWQTDPRVIQAISADNAETREAIDRGFYADLFNAITNMRGIQPRNVEEIAARNEEKLTQLGPVVERVGQEKLKVAIDRAYDILETAGMLRDIPLPPEMEGQAVEVEFISVLAQAQRLIGLGSIERVYGFAASADPDGSKGMLDNLDHDAAVQEYGDITGVAARIIRGKDEVDKIRSARAEAQAQQQQAAQAIEMAKAAKPATEAAALLYDSPGVGSQPNLAERLLGV